MSYHRVLPYVRAASLLLLLLAVPLVTAQSRSPSPAPCTCRINGRCASGSQCQDAGVLAGSVVGGVVGGILLFLVCGFVIVGRIMRRRCCICVSRKGKNGPITSRRWLFSPRGICAENANEGDDSGPCCMDADPVTRQAAWTPPEEPRPPASIYGAPTPYYPASAPKEVQPVYAAPAAPYAYPVSSYTPAQPAQYGAYAYASPVPGMLPPPPLAPTYHKREEEEPSATPDPPMAPVGYTTYQRAGGL